MRHDQSPPNGLAVGIVLFDNVEVLDFCGPFEVFSVAAQIAVDSGAADHPPFHVFTIAAESHMVTTRGGLRVQPHYSIAEHPTIDILVVPGGQGTRREVYNTQLIDWIRQVAATARHTTSVCTGAFLLAQAGLLDQHRATTHWASLDRLAATFPSITVERERRWVDEGAIVSSAGISAGIDMSLHLVERCAGRDVAHATARQMEYQWNEA